MPLDIDWLPTTAVAAAALVALVAIKIMEHLSVTWARRRTRQALRGLDAND